MPWTQRPGYLLERIDEAQKAAPLKEYVRNNAHEAALLLPSAPAADHPRNRDWQLVINADVEAES